MLQIYTLVLSTEYPIVTYIKNSYHVLHISILAYKYSSIVGRIVYRNGVQYMENCVICGKEVVYNEGDENWHPRKYCSYECVKKSKNILRKLRVEKTHVKICMHCHEKFNAKRADSEYCSNKCKQIEYRQRKAGPEEGKKTKLLIFTGRYCPSCLEQKRAMDKFEKKKKNRVYRELFELEFIDIEEKRDLFNYYNVKVIPTLVFLKPNGVKIDVWHGYYSMHSIVNFLLKYASRNKKGLKLDPFVN
jgi:thiol-disulfide isomerase/thioredoxin